MILLGRAWGILDKLMFWIDLDKLKKTNPTLASMLVAALFISFGLGFVFGPWVLLTIWYVIHG